MIDGLASGATRAPWSVAALVREVGELLLDRFSVCTVRGEISGFSRASSGHCYFNLKDADGGSAMLRCAMFRRAASLLDFAPRDGQLVELRGRLGVYEQRGELQLVVEAMRAAGAGALYEQFVRLRARLEAAGLFEAGRKRAPPRFVRAVGVVTSLAGAALHDVLTALARRAPHVRIVVYPSPVQGADAPAALAAAIALASTRAEVEVLIVCRGGGSLEDLWAFNDEQVVRAIVAATMPVVCGVGHETDVTLADLAADLRAPTPTAAAELAAPTRAECLDDLAALQQALQRRVRSVLDRHAQQLDRCAARLTRPDQALRRSRERLMLLGHRLRGHGPHALALQRSRLQRAAAEWRLGARAHLTHQRDRLDALAARLRALGPEQVLARGYAWLGDAAGLPVSSVRQVAIGAPLRAVLHDGSADVVVTAVQGRGQGRTAP